MPNRLTGVVLYACGNKSTILGIKHEVKFTQSDRSWSRYLLHPDVVIEGVVHPSKGMLLYCYFFPSSHCYFAVCVLICPQSLEKFHPAALLPGCTHIALTLCIP